MSSTVKAGLIQTLKGYTNDVTWCDFSGQTLATASNDKLLRLWIKNSDGKFIESPLSPLIGHSYGVNCCRFSPFGTVLASCSTDGSVILWNTLTGQQIASFQHPSGSAVRICCFSPSSTLLATGSDDEVVILWDISTRSAIRTLEGHEAMITSCSFTPDSAYLISASSAGDLKLWDACYGHGKCLLTSPVAHDLGVLGCEFSPQYEAYTGGNGLSTRYLLASCGNDDTVKLWHVNAGYQMYIKLFHTLCGHTGNVMMCRFSTDGELLVSVSGDKTMILWNPSLGQMLQRVEKHGRYVTCCAFSSDNAILATGSNDRTVLLWSLDGTTGEQMPDVQTGTLVSPLTDNSPPVRCLTVSGVNVVTTWSTADVGGWLDKIGMQKYKENFAKNAINGQELLHMTHDGLQNGLKIDALGHRSKILREIQSLRNPLWQHLSLPEDDGVLPEEFFCPITHELMKDPVVASDGHSYEKGAITEWMKSGKDSSPMTNEKLEHKNLIPNVTLRLIIKKYMP